MTVIDNARIAAEAYETPVLFASPEITFMEPSDAPFMNFLGRIEQDESVLLPAREFAKNARELFGLPEMMPEDTKDLTARAAHIYVDDALEALRIDGVFVSPEVLFNKASDLIAAKAAKRSDAYQKLLDACGADSEILDRLAQNQFHSNDAVKKSLAKGLDDYYHSGSYDALLKESMMLLRFQIIDEELEFMRILRPNTDTESNTHKSLGQRLLQMFLVG